MSVHITRLRVCYADTDRMGVVYYANHFIFFERARVELLRDLGWSYRDLEDQKKIYLPVVEAACTYISPAHYDDPLEIHTTLAKVGRASLTFHYEVIRPHPREILARGSTTHVFVNAKFKPTSPPPALRQALLKMKGP